ncbi:EAL domain-containing protein [Luteimonas sp. SX5]|uniref:EAL domain-containing protein n=1 Tax=Luteimonas galliterrae TaxID=2940486 RepID=A0ABT0MI64_9GAMM|nr:EAL domain-containing protein [Luteimonas galliterrae]MCL1633985.1 EAL domain-containing protein [Luteimonas galliterrae]
MADEGLLAQLGMPTSGLAGMLVETLPTGSQLVVRWRDASGREGNAATAGTSRLMDRSARLLAGEAVAAGSDEILETWIADDETRIAIAAALAETLPVASQQAWLALARRTVSATLATIRAQARIESLQKSERLQQALYEIADLAGSGLEMNDMLRRIHAVVGGLMYARNFYIVLYDDVARTLRFLYFADQIDAFESEPDRAIPLDDMPSSLTVGLLLHGEPLRGPSEEIRKKLGIPRDPEHGPDSQDWLGVLMRREGRVSGAIVVQAYDHPASYSDEDRVLLEFVAQHIQTALDRKHAQVELERRVGERTRELQRANEELQAEIVERQRGEELQRALFRIAELTATSDSLERFYAQAHAVVDELLYARNFYVAMLSADGQHLEFPYSVDERESKRKTRRLSSGLTEYVLSTAQPLLAHRSDIVALETQGRVRSFGEQAHCWLGVPLFRGDTVVGVITVQSYQEGISFTLRDQELLTFVAHQIGSGLQRKLAQDNLKAAHLELEQRVEERTRELEESNHKLLAQIGERLRAERRLTHQALHDALTGLPNRAHLLDRMNEAIARAIDDPAFKFAVLFLDLDRFKLVNDSVGHASGDEMLVEAGSRIVSAVRPDDVVARLGGDEFAVLVEGVDSASAAENLAARILRALGAPVWIAGRELFPAASLGIAMWQPRYRSGEELLRDADAAMYRAKALGRGRSAVFDEHMREHAMRLLDLEADLRRAINRDDFEPWYQPIVRLTDGAVIGHEALLRWNHEQRGVLVPGDFMGLGEDSGLIEQVDWMLYQQVAMELSNGGEGYVSVNVSPRHFRSPDFADRLLRMLDVCGADSHRLRIEITEVALLDDAPRALRMLRTLRDHGVLAQLDDFGTGFSALSYLHNFPIATLKIDRSFVAGLHGESSPESMAVTRAILALASALGIETIGEGIETEEQRISLRDLGCEYGQGYLFGHPVPAPRSAARL